MRSLRPKLPWLVLLVQLGTLALLWCPVRRAWRNCVKGKKRKKEHIITQKQNTKEKQKNTLHVGPVWLTAYVQLQKKKRARAKLRALAVHQLLQSRRYP